MYEAAPTEIFYVFCVSFPTTTFPTNEQSLYWAFTTKVKLPERTKQPQQNEQLNNKWAMP